MTISLQHQIALVNYGNYFLNNPNASIDLLSSHELFNQYQNLIVQEAKSKELPVAIVAHNLYNWYAHLIAQEAISMRLLTATNVAQSIDTLSHAHFVIEISYPNKVQLCQVYWQKQGQNYIINVMAHATENKAFELDADIVKIKKELGIKLHILQTIFEAIKEPIWKVQIQAAEAKLSQNPEWDLLNVLTPRQALSIEYAQVLSAIYTAIGFEQELGLWQNIALKLDNEKLLFEDNTNALIQFILYTLMYISKPVIAK
jgi:hypothetical protein